MPMQDNENVKKKPEIEENEHKSETLLPIFNTSYDNHMDKPFAALMEVGKAVSESEFAEIMQSTQAKFSVDIKLDSDKVQLMAVNGGKGGIAESDRNDQNTYFRTAKLSDFAQEKKLQQKESRSEVRKINPNYYKKIPKDDRVITNETAKVGAMIMTELEKQKIPFSAVETDKGVTITVSRTNESAFNEAKKNAPEKQRTCYFERAKLKKEAFKDRQKTAKSKEQNKNKNSLE